MNAITLLSLPSFARRMTRTAAIATLALLATAQAPSPAGLRTYCLEGAKFTCFAIELLTTATATGTDVTLRIQNLQGAAIPNVPAQVDWSRIHSIDLIGASPAFTGGPITSADPVIVATPFVTSFGDMRDAWFSFNIGDATNAYTGYGLETPYTAGGAEILGCGSPPNLGYPFLRTCNATQPAVVEFRFSTRGQWSAAQVGIVVTMADVFASDMNCLIPGSMYDDAAVYHCFDPNAPPPNRVPVANGDAINMAEDIPTDIDVRANDTDADGDALTIQSASTPAHGATQIVAGKVRYTPDPDFNGIDGFDYTVVDGKGGSSTASVALTVTAVNDNPVAANDVVSTASATSAIVSVLANDTDVDGDVLTIGSVTQPANGTAAILPGNLQLRYTPNAGFAGQSQFSYSTSDGHGGTATGTVTANTAPPVIPQATAHSTPAMISLSLTGTVSTYLYSTATFDARSADAATVRLRVDGSSLPGAPVSLRGTSFTTSVADYNGDGRVDRLFVFQRSALVAAGLSLMSNRIVLEDLIGTFRFIATDPTPPTIVP